MNAFAPNDFETFGQLTKPGPYLSVSIQPAYLSIEDIQRAVVEYYGLEMRDMTTMCRPRHIVRPRQIAMYLCRRLTNRSLPVIGARFGGRDHTTVLHAVRTIKACIATDPEIANDVRVLTERLAA